MMRIILAVAAAAAVLTSVPLAAPAEAQGVRIAQGFDIQIGRDRDRDYRDRYYRDRYDDDYDYRDRRRRYDRDATIGIGPGGVTIGRRPRCRVVTTTVERDDGRMMTRRERRCG